MPRGKSTKKKTEAKSDLIEALRHISLCQSEIGNDTETHCVISQGFISATNNILSCGVFINEDLHLRPNTHRLLKALERCEEPISLTPREDKLAIKSGPFKALVPCLSMEGFEPGAPDPILGTLTPAFLDALEVAAVATVDRAPLAMNASLLLRSGSVLGTNGHVLVEAWHGSAMPAEFAIPKSFQVVLSKLRKVPASFGASERSFTVYFDDKSWLRTQLYDYIWPETPRTLLDAPSQPKEVPADFFKAVNKVRAFSQDDVIYLNGYVVSAGNQFEGPTDGALYEIATALPAVKLDAAQLALIEPFAEKIDFTSQMPKCMLWWAENVRGAVAYRI